MTTREEVLPSDLTTELPKPEPHVFPELPPGLTRHLAQHLMVNGSTGEIEIHYWHHVTADGSGEVIQERKKHIQVIPPGSDLSAFPEAVQEIAAAAWGIGGDRVYTEAFVARQQAVRDQLQAAIDATLARADEYIAATEQCTQAKQTLQSTANAVVRQQEALRSQMQKAMEDTCRSTIEAATAQAAAVQEVIDGINGARQ